MDFNLHLNLEMNDTRMIGIFGIGGIGKTTLAKAVYNSIAYQFQGSCFLSNIRELSSQPNGLVILQMHLLYDTLKDSSLMVGSVDQGINLIKQRLSSKRVLLVLDDVDQLFQLESLARECDWFGLGSRIIITTRDRSLLTQHGVDRNYRMGELDRHEAHQLFSLHAFKKEKPNEDYVDVIEQAISYAGGIPLALEVLGSLLRGKCVAQWRSLLEKLKRIPTDHIHNVLRTSFDGLDKTEKDIFLDIACFFKGERVEYVIKILDGCGFFPNTGINVLIEKSLITIDERNTLMMHDLLQQMGREIVRQESQEPSKRSRLWFGEDVRYILEEEMGGSKVEGILVDLAENDLEICLKSKAFEKMKSLRLFINRNAHFSGQPNSLPNELRLIDWPGYPSQSLPPNFRGRKVVVFEMRNSLFKKIDEFKNFNKIRIMEFSDCKFLTKIPDLSNSLDLQELIIDKCTNLVEVHHSVGFLDNLVSLTISRCSKLETLPRILKLRSLTALVLEGCSMLQNFPEIGCKMECLRSIDLRYTAVKELHPSIKYLVGLEDLNLEGCKNLMNLPSSIHLLQHLKNLSLKDCSKLSRFPFQPPMNLSISNDGDSSIASLALQSLNLGNCILSKSYFFRSLNCFSTLEELDLSGCDFVSTTCIKRLVGLRRLILVDCKKLEEILVLPPYIEEVNAGGCISLERFSEVSKRFEFNTCDLPRLVWADLSRCHKLLGNMENEVEKFLSIKGNLEDYICSIIFPENKIPNWFSHQIQTSNSDICEIDITEALCLDEEITGMILGAVIGITDEPQIPLPILCEVDIINGLSRHFEVKKFYLSGSDHLWLQYHIPKLNELKGDNVRVKFQIWYSTALAFFKSCGVHLVHRYEEKTVDQMLNPQVQGGPLEDVDVHLDVPDEAWRARAGIRLASSALGASEVEPFTILSDEEGGDNRPLVRRRVSSLGAARRAPAETSQAGPSVQDFEVGGSSLFDLRQTLAATQDRLDTALAEVESIQGRLKHSEAVLESEKSNAFCLGTESLEKFLLVEENL
ncbi:disease resistance protein Roq1-like [Corylus avellana]|uniref:disease resistance protein Roq1-like n=1 Tax=Corylus avellana TaxID=13451 RepID=UPI00286B40B4|nr:disease resistance protein Roq1-like [Corylus avellana]